MWVGENGGLVRWLVICGIYMYMTTVSIAVNLCGDRLKHFVAKLNCPISSLAYFASFVLTNWFFANFGFAVLPPKSKQNQKLGMDRYTDLHLIPVDGQTARKRHFFGATAYPRPNY